MTLRLLAIVHAGKRVTIVRDGTRAFAIPRNYGTRNPNIYFFNRTRCTWQLTDTTAIPPMFLQTLIESYSQ